MTWIWNATRWAFGAIGLMTGDLEAGRCSELFKQSRYQILNKTGENLEEREINLRLIQVIESYQSSFTDGQTLSNAGKLLRSSDKVETLKKLGFEFALGEIKKKGTEVLLNAAAKAFLTQLAINKDESKRGLKKNVGLNLVIHYLVLTKADSDPKTKEWIRLGIELIEAWPWGTNYKSEVDILIETLKIHEQNLPYVLDSGDLIMAERKLIWQMNEENVGLYIQTQSNLDSHLEANELVNSCLRILRNGGTKFKPSKIVVSLEKDQWEDLSLEESLTFLSRLDNFLLSYKGNFRNKSILKQKVNKIKLKISEITKRLEILQKEKNLQKKRKLEEETKKTLNLMTAYLAQRELRRQGILAIPRRC